MGPKKVAKSEPWTNQHDRELVEMHNEGLSVAAIAKTLNQQFKTKRNEGQCGSRLSRIREKLSEIAPKELKAASYAISKDGRHKIPESLLAKLHQHQHQLHQHQETAQKKQRKNGQPGTPWDIKHDRVLVKMYNIGTPFEDIATALNKQFPEKRTGQQCRSRVGNIRAKVLSKVNLPQRRTGDGKRWFLTENMLRIYHAPNTRKASKASPKPQKRRSVPKAPTPRFRSPVAGNGLSGNYKTMLNIDGSGSLTVLLEGNFAKKQELRDMADRLISNAATLGSKQREAEAQREADADFSCPQD